MLYGRRCYELPKIELKDWNKHLGPDEVLGECGLCGRDLTIEDSFFIIDSKTNKDGMSHNGLFVCEFCTAEIWDRRPDIENEK